MMARALPTPQLRFSARLARRLGRVLLPSLILCACTPAQSPPAGDLGDASVPGPAVPRAARALAAPQRPLAAALSDDGATTYFVAFDAVGQAQLYTLPSAGLPAGGAPTVLDTGNGLLFPTSLAVTRAGDLYVADLGDFGDAPGAVLRLSPGQPPQPIGLGSIYKPTALAVAPNGKDLYAVGLDKTYAPAIFLLADGAAAFAPVFSGAGLQRPSAITFGNDGQLYVLDPLYFGPREGAVLRVSPPNAAVFSKTPLQIHFPGGLSPLGGGAAGLLLTGPGDAGGALLQIGAGGDVTPVALDRGAADRSPYEPVSLQRAGRADRWVLVDHMQAAQAADPPVGEVIHLAP